VLVNCACKAAETAVFAHYCLPTLVLTVRPLWALMCAGWCITQQTQPNIQIIEGLWILWLWIL